MSDAVAEAPSLGSMTAPQLGDWLVSLMDAVVTERGRDFIYRRPGGGNHSPCLYVNKATNEPSCLFGTMLAKAGVPLEWLGQFQADGTHTMGADGVLAKLGVAWSTSDTFRVLGSAVMDAQMAQDSGKPYGPILDDFRAAVAALAVS